MFELTDGNFVQEVMESDTPVLIECFTEWCQPCQILTPMLREIEEKNSPKIKLAVLNVENNPQLASKLNVVAVPKVVVFSHGKQITDLTGLHRAEEYQKIVDDYLGEEKCEQ